MLVQSSKCPLFAKKKDLAPLIMFGSICPSQTQPWAGASQSTVGTWVCCLGSSSSSDLARVACREAALALPAPGIAVPPAEPTYLQVLEGKTTFPTLLSPVLAAYLIEYAKAVQTRSLQHVHCLEQLQDGKVRGGSGERKWVPVTRRMDMQQCQWVVVPYMQQRGLQAALEGRLDGTTRSGQASGWTTLCPK